MSHFSDNMKHMFRIRMITPVPGPPGTAHDWALHGAYGGLRGANQTLLKPTTVVFHSTLWTMAVRLYCANIFTPLAPKGRRIRPIDSHGPPVVAKPSIFWLEVASRYCIQIWSFGSFLKWVGKQIQLFIQMNTVVWHTSGLYVHFLWSFR